MREELRSINSTNRANCTKASAETASVLPNESPERDPADHPRVGPLPGLPEGGLSASQSGAECVPKADPDKQEVDLTDPPGPNPGAPSKNVQTDF